MQPDHRRIDSLVVIEFNFKVPFSYETQTSNNTEKAKIIQFLDNEQ